MPSVDCRQLAAAVMLAACCGMDRSGGWELTTFTPRQQAGRPYSGSKLHAVHGCRSDSGSKLPAVLGPFLLLGCLEFRLAAQGEGVATAGCR
jgi:hypothetical protein